MLTLVYLVTLRAHAANVTWLPDADGDWTTPTNWSSNPALPGVNDDVSINVPGDRLITLSGSGTYAVNSLATAERFTLASGTLQIGTTAQFNTSVTVSGGKLRNGVISVAQGSQLDLGSGLGAMDGVTLSAGSVATVISTAYYLNISNGLILNGTLNIGGTGTSLGDVHLGDGGGNPGTLAGSGSVTFSGAVNGTSYSALANFATAANAAGTLTIGPAMIIHGSNGTIYNHNAAGTIINQGTINADVAGGTLILGTDGNGIGFGAITNQGTLAASNGGTLKFARNIDSTPAGSTIAVNGGTIQSDISLSAANLNLSTGTFTGSGTVTTQSLTWTAGTQSGTGKTTVTSSLTLSTDAAKTLSRNLDNTGAASWSGGAVTLNNAVFTNLAGAVFNISAANSFLNGTNANAFNNAGTISKTASSIAIIDLPFNNLSTGVVNLTDGTLGLTGGGTNAGSINVSTGATLRLSGIFNHTGAGTITGTGGLDFNATTISLDGNVTFDGNLSFSTANATIKADATANKISLLNTTASVAAGGNLNVGSGGLAFSGATNNTITLQPATNTPGKLKLSGNVDFSNTAGTASIATADYAVGQTPGLLDLNAAPRTFTVADGSAAIDVSLSARLINGSLIKSGPGLLRLETANSHTTTLINNGTLEAIDPAGLGSGLVTLNAGTLSLKSDAASPVVFGNAISITGDAAINVDCLSAATSGTLRLGNASIGSSHLTLTGANRSLEVTGLTLTASPTLDTAVAMSINGPITQSTAGLGFTKSNGAAKLTLTGVTPNTYSGPTRVNAGTLELAKPANVTAVPGDLSLFGGVVRLLADQQVAATSQVSVNNAGTTLDFNAHSQTLASLTLINALATAGPGGASVIRTGALSISGVGRFDLGSNQLILDYPNPVSDPSSVIRGYLATGYHNGLQDGVGLVNTTANTTPAQQIGYAKASDILSATGGAFAAQNVDGTTLLIRTTLAGDANLDGTVDFNDLVQLAQNYNTPNPNQTWFAGDFTYDGNVDFSDLVKLAQNYNTALPSDSIPGAPSTFLADWNLARATIPEPTTLLFLITTAALATRRRQRDTTQ